MAVAVAGSALIEQQSLVAGTDVFHINTAASRSWHSACVKGGRGRGRNRKRERGRGRQRSIRSPAAHRKCRSGQTQSERALLFWTQVKCLMRPHCAHFPPPLTLPLPEHDRCFISIKCRERQPWQVAAGRRKHVCHAARERKRSKDRNLNYRWGMRKVGSRQSRDEGQSEGEVRHGSGRWK